MGEQHTQSAGLKEKELYKEGRSWMLAVLHAKNGRHWLALLHLKYHVRKFKDPDVKAIYYMRMGLQMEAIKDYEAAIRYYSFVFSLKCRWILNVYFMNNNTGYCLNQRKRYKEAEPYCRAAINIDSTRHNAYKNLGVSLQGQGLYRDAVRCLKKATKLYPLDYRAAALTESIIADYEGDRLMVGDSRTL